MAANPLAAMRAKAKAAEELEEQAHQATHSAVAARWKHGAQTITKLEHRITERQERIRSSSSTEAPRMTRQERELAKIAADADAKMMAKVQLFKGKAVKGKGSLRNGRPRSQRGGGRGRGRGGGRGGRPRVETAPAETSSFRQKSSDKSAGSGESSGGEGSGGEGGGDDGGMRDATTVHSVAIAAARRRSQSYSPGTALERSRTTPLLEVVAEDSDAVAAGARARRRWRKAGRLVRSMIRFQREAAGGRARRRWKKAGRLVISMVRLRREAAGPRARRRWRKVISTVLAMVRFNRSGIYTFTSVGQAGGLSERASSAVANVNVREDEDDGEGNLSGDDIDGNEDDEAKTLEGDEEEMGVECDTHRSRLIRFYSEKAPDKVSSVDNSLAHFKGNEDVMWAALLKKYGPSKFEVVGPRPGETMHGAVDASSSMAVGSPREMKIRLGLTREKLAAFYTIYDPSKLGSLDAILDHPVLTFANVNDTCRNKYGVSPMDAAFDDSVEASDKMVSSSNPPTLTIDSTANSDSPSPTSSTHAWPSSKSRPPPPKLPRPNHPHRTHTNSVSSVNSLNSVTSATSDTSMQSTTSTMGSETPTSRTRRKSSLISRTGSNVATVRLMYGIYLCETHTHTHTLQAGCFLTPCSVSHWRPCIT